MHKILFYNKFIICINFYKNKILCIKLVNYQNKAVVNVLQNLFNCNDDITV